MCRKDQTLLVRIHGNHDDERESIRTDAAVVSHIGFRILYSYAVCNGFIMGKADVRGAYTQSGLQLGENGSA